MPLIKSISGLRATLGDFLTPEIISNYSASFAEIIPMGKIAVGRDGRPSGKWLEQIVAGTLSACGRDVILLGIVPTPTVQLFAEKEDFAGGIAITASHNPSEWNGLKFIDEKGIFLDAMKNQLLWEIIENKQFKFSKNNFGNILIEQNAINEHCSRILNLNIIKESVENIRSKKYKIVVDAVNSSGSVAVPQLLNELGCEVIPLYCEGNGIFPHTPEPLPENLNDLCAAVRVYKADLGIAVDPDADRLVLIDENGNAIGEEKTIVIAILSVFNFYSKNNFHSKINNNEKLKAVINLSTTRLAEDIVNHYGGELYRSPVGEINVVNKMKEFSAIIGGEGSGGVIYPECHYGRDSLVGTALLLSYMANSGSSLSKINSNLPKYSMLKYKQQFNGDIFQLLEKLKMEFSDCRINLDDGIRFDFEDSWVQLRKSNTEPIIRIIAEAKFTEEAELLKNRVIKYL